MSRKPQSPLEEITAQLKVLSRRLDELGAHAAETRSLDGRDAASMVGNSWSLDPEQTPPVPQGRIGI